MKHEEDRILMAYVKWFKYQYPTALAWHTPNGGRRGIREAGRFKAMGVLPGVSDWIIIQPKHHYSGLVIEFKSEKGKLQDSQRQFMNDIYKRGFAWCIVRSFQEAQEKTDKYMMGEWDIIETKPDIQ